MSLVSSSSPTSSSFELKNATLTLIALVLRTTDLELLSQALEERFGPTPALFEHDPVVIDLAEVATAAEPVDFGALRALLLARRLLPVGVERGSPEQMEAALAAGLAESTTFAAAQRAVEGAAAPRTVEELAATRTVEDAAPRAPAPPRAEHAAVAALVIDRPLRSGQQVYARGGDLVVLAAVNFGAAVRADGHIHVYAPLRGRAIAGARGNAAARIFSTCMEPQLVSIAGTYRTGENALPADVHGKPAQVRLDGETLRIEALES
jgi:septum site-determining protein MinC